jgi:hypothetical protein
MMYFSIDRFTEVPTKLENSQGVIGGFGFIDIDGFQRYWLLLKSIIAPESNVYVVQQWNAN